ncbi:MAG: glycosyltransferase family 2 protein [Pseudomonadota bacterium]
MNNIPFITVCMPVYNESEFIKRTIFQILNQDYPENRFEIIVADGHSSDDTWEIVKKIQLEHPQVLLCENLKRKSSSGRNIGFKKGKGDIFVVIDGHCYIPDNQLFKNIINCFEKSGAQCLGRPQPLDPPDISDFQKAVALARKSKIGHGGDSLIYSNYEGFISPVSNGAIYKKEVIEKIGYVDESFDACEDVEFNCRVEKAGFKTFMSPTLTIKYYPRENIRSLLQQMIRYGKGRINLLKKYPETFSFTGVIPFFFVTGIILMLLSSIISKTLVSLFIIPYLIYFFLISFFSIKLCINNRTKYFITHLKIFSTIHTGLGIGQLIGLYDVSIEKMLLLANQKK